jgi:hypothetical protein
MTGKEEVVPGTGIDGSSTEQRIYYPALPEHCYVITRTSKQIQLSCMGVSNT